MKSKFFKKFLSLIMIFCIFAFIFLNTAIQAKCPENVVPNILDPDCTLGDQLTLGFFINRIIQFVPMVLVFILLGVLLWGVFTLMTAGTDEGKRKEAIKILQNAGIGLIMFLALGTILFLISVIFGVDILSWIGL